MQISTKACLSPSIKFHSTKQPHQQTKDHAIGLIFALTHQQKYS